MTNKIFNIKDWIKLSDYLMATYCLPVRYVDPRSTFLMLPREIRDRALENVLPSHESISVSLVLFTLHYACCMTDSTQLSQLPLFEKRATWECKGRKRADPPILSVNKQLKAEATEILYRRTFIVDVNCGMSEWAAHFDPSWRRVPELASRFPFHKVTSITLRIGVFDQDQPNHLFDHMLNICGLLKSKAANLNNLTVQIHDGYEQWEWVDRNCREYNVFPISDLAEKAGIGEGYEVEDIVKSTEFFLQPLALLARMATCTITLPSDLEDNKEMLDLKCKYEKTVNSDQPFSHPNQSWLWKRYLSIVDEEAQLERHRVQAQLRRHREQVIRLEHARWYELADPFND